jgi:PIN domain nuclease of toxin-antitoxin system
MLPFHHKDPFDRLLVAQALLEHMTLVTQDKRLAYYGIPIIDA